MHADAIITQISCYILQNTDIPIWPCQFSTSDFAMPILLIFFEWSDEVRAKREPSSRNEYIK